MGSMISRFGTIGRQAVGLAPILAVLGLSSVLAADPTNIFKAVGIDVVHLDPTLAGSLGGFASVYVSLMNGAVVLAMLLFMYSSFRHVIRGVTASHKANTSGFGEQASGQAVFVDTLYSVIESMAVTVVTLFVVINGANLALSIATGTQGMFVVSQTETLPKLLGPFGGVAASLQGFASLGIILLGAAVAVWKSLGVLRENYYGSHRGASGSMDEDGETSGAYGGKPAMHRTQALVKELAFVLALTILGYVVIRQGPNIVLSFLSGLSSVAG